MVGAHAGLYTGKDGATHQMLEDIAIMRAMPNMVVVVPGDAIEAEKATIAIAEDSRPAYLRLARENIPTFTTEKTPFSLARAYVLTTGKDLTIVSTGTMTYQALLAAEALYKDGVDVEVVHVPVIKPLDTITLLSSIQKTGAVITIEEAQINGGLGSAVAEFIVEHHPVPMRRMGVRDVFGESGDPVDLFKAHGLTAKNIQLVAHKLFSDIGRQ
jgi:transketolase